MNRRNKVQSSSTVFAYAYARVANVGNSIPAFIAHRAEN